jgi:regulator of RNase E activity RraB
MSEHWEVYFSENEGQAMSILVDMDITEEIEVEAYPVAMIVRLAYKNQEVNGFPTSEEAQIMDQLEDQLIEQMEKHSAITPGRITSNGTREYVYYAQRNIDHLLLGICEQLFTPKGYTFDIIELQEEEPWDFYFNALYPTPYEQQHIGNQWVIDQLEQHGNRAEVPREITHLIYFRDTKGMKKFLKAVKKEGFVPDTDSKEVNEEGYYTCLINHTDAVELPIINSVTDYLITLSEKYEGIYDGWETSVIQ